jgi:hypothetical protein
MRRFLHHAPLIEIIDICQSETLSHARINCYQQTPGMLATHVGPSVTRDAKPAVAAQKFDEPLLKTLSWVRGIGLVILCDLPRLTKFPVRRNNDIVQGLRPQQACTVKGVERI